MRHCENEYCENEAVKAVPVSVKGPGDETRWLCRPCATAYEMGVQHGTVCPLPGVATSEIPPAPSQQGRNRVE